MTQSQTPKDEELRAKLIEDTGSPEEAERLAPVVRRLQSWSAPKPGPTATVKLIARLEAEIPNPQSPITNLLSSWPILLLRAQLRVVRGEIWAASALVMALGLLVTLATYSAAEAWPLVLVAPLVAATGVAFIYGPDVDPALEIELATPVPPRLVLLARLALVFGFNLIMGLAASLILSLARAEVAFWPLVSTWLAPLSFLSALAFLLTVFTVNSTTSAMISLLGWAFQSLRQLGGLKAVAWFMPDLMAASARPWLWALALLLAALALWLGGREERWLRGQA
ncbi:MAG: hypothetical protein HW378_1462 [Anaerolineales bacterium]|nr:hypothetical protein [Anaerolineales bacterium]